MIFFLPVLIFRFQIKMFFFYLAFLIISSHIALYVVEYNMGTDNQEG